MGWPGQHLLVLSMSWYVGWLYIQVSVGQRWFTHVFTFSLLIALHFTLKSVFIWMIKIHGCPIDLLLCNGTLIERTKESPSWWKSESHLRSDPLDGRPFQLFSQTVLARQHQEIFDDLVPFLTGEGCGAWGHCFTKAPPSPSCQREWPS